MKIFVLQYLIRTHAMRAASPSCDHAANEGTSSRLRYDESVFTARARRRRRRHRAPVVNARSFARRSSSVLTINQALTAFYVFFPRTALIEVAQACQTRVTLTCAACGSSVAPCDVCEALVETRRVKRGERPARCCARCGGLCVSGDALRARIGLDAVHVVDPLRAVDMTIASGRVGTRERCLATKRARLKALESATRPFVEAPPLRGSTNRGRPNSITTTDDTGTPTDAERERDCRRLTLSSVQCGQRLPPDSIFKTPAPTSRLGRVSRVPNSASSSLDDALAVGDKIEGEITRLKLQILHLESTRRRRRIKRDFTSVDHDILAVTLKKAKVADESVDVVLDVSRSFLRDRVEIQQTMDECAESRLALETLERDTRSMNIANTDMTMETTKESPSEATEDENSPIPTYWPKIGPLDDVSHGVRLLKNQLKKRSTLAEETADVCGAAHLKRLGEITRTQNELFVAMGSKDIDAKHASYASLALLIALYSAMFRDIVKRRRAIQF